MNSLIEKKSQSKELIKNKNRVFNGFVTFDLEKVKILKKQKF